MKETIQEYVQRISTKIQGQDPLRVQAATAKKLTAALRRGTAAKLRKRPAPEKWSVVEILAHLADAETVVGWRLRSILSAPGSPIQAYDQDAWAIHGQYAKRDPRKSLERFRVQREANLELVKSLTPEQRRQVGLHSERGEESIERLTLLIAGHDLNHLEQIEAILTAKHTNGKK
jgi:DinB superfamily